MKRSLRLACRLWCCVVCSLFAVAAFGEGANGSPTAPARPLLEEGAAATGKKEEKEEKKKHDLEAWGRLETPLKDADGFWGYSYYQRTERGTLKRVRALLQVPDELKPKMDVPVPYKELKEGETIFLLAKPVTLSTTSPQGFVVHDYQISGCQGILCGADVTVNKKYKDRRDPDVRWLEATVVSVEGQVKVKYDNQTNRVLIGRSTPVLRRQKGDPKYVRKGAYVFVQAQKSTERPPNEKKSDEEKVCFRAEQIVVLYPRYVKTLYPTVFE